MLRIFLDISTTGLNAYKHRLGCISVNSEKETESFCDEDEKKMLEDFIFYLSEKVNRNKRVNIYSFRTEDFIGNFLKTRMLKHKLLSKYLDLTSHIIIYDIQRLFFDSHFFGVTRKPKLGEIIKFLDIKAPMIIKGEDKKYMFENEMYDNLIKYTEQSVNTIKLVFLNLKYKLNIKNFEVYELSKLEK